MHESVPLGTLSDNSFILSDPERSLGYCPVSKNTGFCGGGVPPGGAAAALSGADRSVIRMSGVLVPPVGSVVVVVAMSAIDPASQIAT